MHDDLVRLQRMDHHDRAASRASHAAEALRQARVDAEMAVSDAEAHAANLDVEAQELRKRELGAQRELEQARTYRDRATRALEQGLGDPDAAQRQLERTTEQIDDLETQLLERMEEADELTARRSAAAGAVDAARVALADLLGTYDALLAEHQATAHQEAGEVQALGDGLPAELRTRYQDFRHKRRWAVATIRDGACNACNKVVTQQHVTDLRRGLLKPCLGCSRFLVLEEG